MAVMCCCVGCLCCNFGVVSVFKEPRTERREDCFLCLTTGSILHASYAKVIGSAARRSALIQSTAERSPPGSNCKLDSTGSVPAAQKRRNYPQKIIHLGCLHDSYNVSRVRVYTSNNVD